MGRLDYETAFIDQYSRPSIRGRVEHLLGLCGCTCGKWGFCGFAMSQRATRERCCSGFVASVTPILLAAHCHTPTFWRVRCAASSAPVSFIACSAGQRIFPTGTIRGV